LPGQRFYGSAVDGAIFRREQLGPRVHDGVPEGRWFLELNGFSDRLSTTFSAAGGRVVWPAPHVLLKHSQLVPSFGLLREVRSWIGAGSIWCLRVALPPFGLLASQPTRLNGLLNLLAFAGAMRLHVCIEAPLGSRWWRQRRIQRLSRQFQWINIDFDTCAFGTAFRKPTRIRTTMRDLLPARRN
jgi:hypothetical protein